MDTTQFVAAVERHISAATYQPRFSTDDILAFASEEQRITVVPAIKSLVEEYFVVTKDVPIVPDDDFIDIPTRAVGRNIRKAELSIGNNTAWAQMPRLNLDEASGFLGSTQTGAPGMVLFYDDRIRLVPISNQNAIVRLWFELAPSDLVQTTETALMSQASVLSATATVEAVPADLIAGTEIDLVTAQGAHRLLIMDGAIQSAGTSSITLTEAFTAPAGSIISPAGFTSIIQLPKEAVDVLIFATGLRMLESQSITEHADRMLKLRDRAMNAMTLALKGRNINSLQKTKPSPLLGPGNWGRGRYNHYTPTT